MGEKVTNVAIAVIGLATIAVIFKSGKTGGIVKNFGQAFGNVIASAEHG